jgi:signal transduction histidine kinase
LFDSSVRVPSNIGNSWYKIAELAIDNAIKHANATGIEIHVRRTRKNVTLEIRDNGSGFSLLEAKVNPKGLGLLLIQHYATQSPITVDVRSTPGKGTLVRSTYVEQSEK